MFFRVKMGRHNDFCLFIPPKVVATKKKKREREERHKSITVLQNDRQRSWSVFSQRSSVGQLAQTRSAKHRAVGMATEEHFPPNPAPLRRRDKE